MTSFRQQDNIKGHWDLKKVGFIGGNVNPCLYVTKGAKVVAYVALFVHNNSVVRNPEDIDVAIEAIQKNGLLQDSLL